MGIQRTNRPNHEIPIHTIYGWPQKKHHVSCPLRFHQLQPLPHTYTELIHGLTFSPNVKLFTAKAKLTLHMPIGDLGWRSPWGIRLTGHTTLHPAQLLCLRYSNRDCSTLAVQSHNIIQIRNNVIWGWKYSTIYSIIQTKCEEYPIEYCRSHMTLLWI